MLGLAHSLAVSAALFVIGIFVLFLNLKNILIFLMSIELMLLSLHITFVAFSAFLGDYVGQMFPLLVVSLAAAVVAIGFVSLVSFRRNKGSTDGEDVNVTKG